MVVQVREKGGGSGTMADHVFKSKPFDFRSDISSALDQRVPRGSADQPHVFSTIRASEGRCGRKRRR